MMCANCARVAISDLDRVCLSTAWNKIAVVHVYHKLARARVPVSSVTFLFFSRATIMSGEFNPRRVGVFHNTPVDRTLMFLERLSAACGGVPLHQLFDAWAVTGTSTVLAVAIGLMRCTAAQCRDLLACIPPMPQRDTGSDSSATNCRRTARHGCDVQAAVLEWIRAVAPTLDGRVLGDFPPAAGNPYVFIEHDFEGNVHRHISQMPFMTWSNYPSEYRHGAALSDGIVTPLISLVYAITWALVSDAEGERIVQGCWTHRSARSSSSVARPITSILEMMHETWAPPAGRLWVNVACDGQGFSSVDAGRGRELAFDAGKPLDKLPNSAAVGPLKTALAAFTAPMC